MVNSLAIIIT